MPTGDSTDWKTKKQSRRLGPSPGQRSPPRISYPALLRARVAQACHNPRPAGKTRWTRQVPMEMLIINNISCDDAMRTTFTDVKGSRRTVKRNPTNSMTGTFSRLYLKEKSWSVRSTNATRHWWAQQTAGLKQARKDQVLAKVRNLATGWEL